MDQKDQRRHTGVVYVWGRQFFPKITQRKQKLIKRQLCVDTLYAFTGKRVRKPRKNIEALNMDNQSGLSSIKLMEETDISVQIYSFLKVTAVHYDASLRTQTYFRLSLVPPKITSAYPSQKTISVT